MLCSGRARGKTAADRAAIAAAKELEKQQKKEARERARQEKAAQKYAQLRPLHLTTLSRPSSFARLADMGRTSTVTMSHDGMCGAFFPPQIPAQGPAAAGQAIAVSERPCAVGTGSWRSSRELRSAWTGRGRVVCPANLLIPLSPCVWPHQQLCPFMMLCKTLQDIAGMLQLLLCKTSQDIASILDALCYMAHRMAAFLSMLRWRMQAGQRSRTFCRCSAPAP